ncbi:MAG: hypothetical protein GVY28_13200 [Alphaproteobacteria bacterium]|jgi:proteasome assembly chaperone (PAC2) family protein|nr:hypothetical protein [Alphaproteobacteria bacterium]
MTDAPHLGGATMLLAFSGWMDGGEVSTGTVRRLIEHFDAQPFGNIDPEGYYIESFPGAMEVAAMFRPHVNIVDGVIEAFTPSGAAFYASDEPPLVYLIAREPNLRWQRFAERILDVAAQTGVSRLVFVGSFAGAVPHTREPRLHSSVTDPAMLDELRQYGVRPSQYEGPASFSTYLMTLARFRNLPMINLVAEIPAYIEGRNPMSIEAVTRRLAAVLGVQVDLPQMRSESDEWERQVSERVEENEELAEQIRELEEAYDDDLIESDADPDWIDDTKPD